MTDDELAMAYVDGELDAVTARRLERRMADEPALAGAVEAQRALRGRLRDAFAPIAEDPVPPHLAAMLETNVVQIAPRRQPIALWRNAAALAACLVAGVTIGQYWRTGPVAMSDGQLIASGSLARSLDTDLAGGRQSTRLLLSFRDRSGTYCRLFETAAIDGIACRASGGWMLRQTNAPSGTPAGEYRQAASGKPGLMAAAQEMMAGAPLDPEAERRARDAGWR
jgi:hypothetical protein